MYYSLKEYHGLSAQAIYLPLGDINIGTDPLSEIPFESKKSCFLTEICSPLTLIT